MIDFKSVTDFFSDKSKSWGFKTATFISIIGLIFLIDICFGFSYNYHINSKLKNLKEIKGIKDNYMNDSTKLIKLSEFENEILYKDHYLKIISNKIRNISLINDITDKNQIQNNQTTNTPVITIKKDVRNLYWMIGSSNFLIVIILPILLFLPLFGGKESRNADMIVGIFASIIFLSIFSTVTTWIAYKIPLILDKPFLNYLLNFLIQALFWFFVIKKSNNEN